MQKLLLHAVLIWIASVRWLRISKVLVQQMLVKWIPKKEAGGNLNGAVSYILGEKNSAGKQRDDLPKPCPKCSNVSPEELQTIEESMTQKNTYSHAVISFSPSDMETLSKEDREAIVNDFVNECAGGLERDGQRLPHMSVWHNDGQHCHVLINHLDIDTGNHTSPYVVQRGDKHRFNDWKSAINFEYGLQPPVNDISCRVISTAKDLTHANQFVNHINKKIGDGIDAGAINNKADIHDLIRSTAEKHSKLSIAKETANSFTINVDGAKAFVLRTPQCNKDGSFMLNTKAEHNPDKAQYFRQKNEARYARMKQSKTKDSTELGKLVRSLEQEDLIEARMRKTRFEKPKAKTEKSSKPKVSDRYELARDVEQIRKKIYFASKRKDKLYQDDLDLLDNEKRRHAVDLMFKYKATLAAELERREKESGKPFEPLKDCTDWELKQELHKTEESLEAVEPAVENVLKVGRAMIQPKPVASKDQVATALGIGKQHAKSHQAGAKKALQITLQAMAEAMAAYEKGKAAEDASIQQMTARLRREAPVPKKKKGRKK
ncbi:hypothetical protein FEF65_10740 [Mariprofundus erugo]|uniref:MobA/VirD2-like nuclease domain-containing protein n=1 Tax=Mariprofundus erugo TaxID=2528639 RepID=A0A5R9GPF1_9PROT|nr:relaxase/mobilization nuclease domain-containing protein [Mariprofundus erugo]TLS66283.1 hypothetical protein FEF65_10740 [Mariprofundus erugo]